MAEIVQFRNQKKDRPTTDQSAMLSNANDIYTSIDLKCMQYPENSINPMYNVTVI